MKIITKIMLPLFVCGLSGCRPSEENICLLTVDIIVFEGTGQATLVATPSGGLEPYSYDWNGAYNDDEKHIVWNGTGDQGPGTHTVTVYDAGGCSAEATVNVIFPCDSLYSVNDADGNSYHVIAIGNQCCTSTQSL